MHSSIYKQFVLNILSIILFILYILKNCTIYNYNIYICTYLIKNCQDLFTKKIAYLLLQTLYKHCKHDIMY